jgi:uncharacterized Zn finger protein (UPF0148 family)
MKNNLIVLAQKMLAQGDYKLTTALLDAEKTFTFTCDMCGSPAIFTKGGSKYCAEHMKQVKGK